MMCHRHEDSQNQKKLSKLFCCCTFASWDESVCLKNYGTSMKENQALSHHRWNPRVGSWLCFPRIASAAWLRVISMIELSNVVCCIQKLKEFEGKFLELVTKLKSGKERERERGNLKTSVRSWKTFWRKKSKRWLCKTNLCHPHAVLSPAHRSGWPTWREPWNPRS